MGCSGSMIGIDGSERACASEMEPNSQWEPSESSENVVPKKLSVTYECGELIGKGAFAQVYAAKLLENSPEEYVSTTSKQGTPRSSSSKDKRSSSKDKWKPTTEIEFAIKIIDLREDLEDRTPRARDASLSSTKSSKKSDRAEKEIELWKKVSGHPHVVTFNGAFERDQTVCMVMERCCESLSQMLRCKPLRTQERAVTIVSEMLTGIAHVHRLGVVHRDVKGDNYLVGGDTGEVVKLCDFGLSAMLPEKGTRLRGLHGSTPNMSPEMLLHKGHDDRTDVWSLGATLYETFYGVHPYEPDIFSTQAMKELIRKGTPAPKFIVRSACKTSKLKPSRGMERFVKNLLTREHLLRPSAKKAVKNLVHLTSPSKLHWALRKQRDPDG